MNPISHKFFEAKEKSLQDRLRQLFRTGFTAIDIAEPLVCFDGEKSAREELDIMHKRKISIAGVHDKDVFVGIIVKGQCADGYCREIAKTVEPDCILTYSAPYQQIIEVLDIQDICLITFLGQIAGIIQRKDIKKPSVRMWLFGLITIMEMVLSNTLKHFYPNDSWKAELPEARLEKAQSLQTERRNRGQDIELRDCLYFVDKASILAKNPLVREEFGFKTRTEAKQMISKLESLRNSLAHTHDIVTYDWKAIVEITRRLDRTLSRL